MVVILREFLIFEWLSFNFTLVCAYFLFEASFDLVITVVIMTLVGAILSYFTLPIFVKKRLDQC